MGKNRARNSYLDSRMLKNISKIAQARGLIHKVNTVDGRSCVIEESGNKDSEKSIIFLPGALGSLKTDFQPQFAEDRKRIK